MKMVANSYQWLVELAEYINVSKRPSHMWPLLSKLDSDVTRLAIDQKLCIRKKDYEA
jgi:hypothetical protein